MRVSLSAALSLRVVGRGSRQQGKELGALLHVPSSSSREDSELFFRPVFEGPFGFLPRFCALTAIFLKSKHFEVCGLSGGRTATVTGRAPVVGGEGCDW